MRSWTRVSRYDLTSSAFAGNYFSMAGHIELQRHFFINERYGGCGNDWGWLISASGTTCSWESSRNAAPALLFSDGASLPSPPCRIGVGRCAALRSLTPGTRELTPVFSGCHGICATSHQLRERQWG